MKEFIDEFRNVISLSEEKLMKISEEQSSRSPQPGKWSSKQILGHLVDSSFNNIIRFINGQFMEDLNFSGYDQDKWVEAQKWNTAGWQYIIDLWRNNNLQIASVVESIPKDVLVRLHGNHNYDVIAFVELSKDKPASLEYLIRDYLAHMKHHLNQISKINSLNGIN